MIAGKLVGENGWLASSGLEPLRSQVNAATERLDAETADNRDLVRILAPSSVAIAADWPIASTL